MQKTPWSICFAQIAKLCGWRTDWSSFFLLLLLLFFGSNPMYSILRYFLSFVVESNPKLNNKPMIANVSPFIAFLCVCVWVIRPIENWTTIIPQHSSNGSSDKQSVKSQSAHWDTRWRARPPQEKKTRLMSIGNRCPQWLDRTRVEGRFVFQSNPNVSRGIDYMFLCVTFHQNRVKPNWTKPKRNHQHWM